MDKGIVPSIHQKMDIAKIEAMICESGLNTKNSRILFKHLNQFFLFREEALRLGQDFLPKVDWMILLDKTTIHCWYKRPDEVIKDWKEGTLTLAKTTVVVKVMLNSSCF